MKILILANEAVGLYSFRRELVQRLVSHGYEVVFSVPNNRIEESVTSLVALGARYVQTEYLSRRGTNPTDDLKLLAFYRELLRHECPDVVLTYTIKPNVYGGIACQAEGIPYLANVTGLGTSIQNGGALQHLTLDLYRRGLAKARLVFFQNVANKSFFEDNHIVNVPTHLLPGSGVNTSWFKVADYPDRQQPTTFLTVGRIMRDKGTVELVEAACEVKSKHLDVRFVLVGPFDESLEDAVRYADSAGVLEYVPAQSDVRPYYMASHALVHPSYHEGMSNVCLEAAAMGRAVIASNVPGCRETFDDGVTGIGFEPRNVESLVGTLEHFIALPWEQKRAMGLAGREKVVREFNRQIVVDAYMREIERCG